MMNLEREGLEINLNRMEFMEWEEEANPYMEWL